MFNYFKVGDYVKVLKKENLTKDMVWAFERYAKNKNLWGRVGQIIETCSETYNPLQEVPYYIKFSEQTVYVYSLFLGPVDEEDMKLINLKKKLSEIEEIFLKSL